MWERVLILPSTEIALIRVEYLITFVTRATSKTARERNLNHSSVIPIDNTSMITIWSVSAFTANDLLYRYFVTDSSNNHCYQSIIDTQPLFCGPVPGCFPHFRSVTRKAYVLDCACVNTRQASSAAYM